MVSRASGGQVNLNVGLAAFKVSMVVPFIYFVT